MASRSVVVAVSLSALALLGALSSYVQVRRLRAEAQSLLTRGEAEAQEYAATFDGAFADQQNRTLEQRRGVLERAHAWQRIEAVLILCAVIGGFTTYLLYLLHRLRQQLLDADVELSSMEKELHEVRS